MIGAKCLIGHRVVAAFTEVSILQLFIIIHWSLFLRPLLHPYGFLLTFFLFLTLSSGVLGHVLLHGTKMLNPSAESLREPQLLFLKS